MPSLIERLPSEPQRLIFSNLDYQSLIFLSTLNRHFHRSINPQIMADPLDKFQFVMRAAKDFPQHRPSENGQNHQPGNFECYICFRVRVPEHFDALQRQSAYVDIHGRVVSDRGPSPDDRLVPLRRFCIECGVKFGLHAPSDSLATKTGQDRWVCRCRKVWQKTACLKCLDCGGSFPFRPKRKWRFESGILNRTKDIDGTVDIAYGRLSYTHKYRADGSNGGRIAPGSTLCKLCSRNQTTPSQRL